MPTQILRLSPLELVRLLRAETEAAHGQPELNTTMSREHIIAEDFDRSAFGLHDGEQLDLVTEVTILTIEPRIERDYWTLEITAEHPLGPMPSREENALERKELTLDEVEIEVRSAAPKRATVRLIYETPTAKRRFDRWLADMRRHHPSEPRAHPTHPRRHTVAPAAGEE
jgi:hypothetical protein